MVAMRGSGEVEARHEADYPATKHSPFLNARPRMQLASRRSTLHVGQQPEVPPNVDGNDRKPVKHSNQAKHMKHILTLGLIGIAAGALFAADSNPKDKVSSAAKLLGDKANYSWAMVTKEADGSPGRLGTLEGKTEKSGVLCLNFTVGDVPVQVYMKGQKGAARAQEGWQTFDDIAQTSGTAAAVVRFLRSYKTPAAQCADLANKVKELKETEGALAGDLKEEAIQEMLLMGRRQREGQEPPKITGAKGSVKFWIKQGAMAKYEVNLQGKVSAGDREMDINRTMTTEIKDVGSTKMEVPTEAKAKME
jgi:hypothetical protein